MGYYKAVINGSYSGQQIVNILWYRAVDSVLLGLLDPTTGEDLSYQILQEVIPPWLVVHPIGYSVENITVYPFNTSLLPAFNQPFVRNVNQAGGQSADTNGPAVTAIVRFNVATVPAVNVVYPLESGPVAPKRGYLAYGPIIDGTIENDGLLNATTIASTAFQDVLAALCRTLTNLNPPALFVPLRARHKKIAGLLTLQGFAPVVSASWRRRATFRRSRLPEPV